MYLVVTVCASKSVPRILPFAYDVKEQVCHDALLASLSGKSHCVAPRSLGATQLFPGRDPT